MGVLPWEPFEDPAVSWAKLHGGPVGVVEEERPEGVAEADWRIQQRCKRELKKKVPAWKTITNETVTENHSKTRKGMLYGITFPWTEDMLHSEEWGAEWLTKAMHAAGTLPQENRVTKVIPDKRYRITTGNNGGKFLFEVEYEIPDDCLHTKLFAKIPHGMEKETMSDRLSSSVNKQPMELYELNTSRLLEAKLPVKIPRFYFGDISNETSNWILITEAVKFHDPSRLDFEGKTRDAPKQRLRPYEVEGPYDKCMDWCLRGDPAEYYLALVRQGGLMAGRYKAGSFGDPKLVSKHFEDMTSVPMEGFGMQTGCSGQPPNMLKSKIDMGFEFFGNTAAHLYPSHCTDPAWQDSFRATLMKLNAYAAESQYFFHHNEDYISLAHGNMNVDNAYFWRNEAGELELGVFDWGGMGARSLGFKLWWWLYCADFEVLNANMDKFLDCLVSSYAEGGGPKLDKEVLRMMFVLASHTQMFGLLAAIGQIYRMCPKKEFPNIKDRYDPKIAENINDKSTLRLYIQVMRTVTLIHKEWQADKIMDDFETQVVELTGSSKKDPSTMQA